MNTVFRLLPEPPALMKIPIYNILILALIFMSCERSDPQRILIEAESFKEKGGWVVDPQFEGQIGSPYLLAHGLGIPVADARSEFKVQVKGRYFVWVRTKNWAPGKWVAPGRFKLRINSSEFKTELGTKEGWSWQYAGAVTLKDTIASVTLRDLTGFDGRCDAIYLSTDKKEPPEDLTGLKKLRSDLLGESDPPANRLDFDLVVIGGGIAGCAASIAAAEQGLKVALIQDRPVLGGNASSEVRVHTEGITWKSDRILNMLNTVWWPNGSSESLKDDKKRHDNMSKFPNISIFLNYKAYAANTISDSITSVDARNTSSGEKLRFSAPVFIDCTGDGWIGYWAGADYMYGREDSSKYGENWSRYGELWSPSKADNNVMGSSVLWETEMKEHPVSFPEVPWAQQVSGQYSATGGTWQWEFSRNDLNQVDDGEYIRDHMLMAVYGSFRNAKNKAENANLSLKWVSYLIGKRESRRLVGDYIYTFMDEKNMTDFPDAVVMEKRNIDVHYQQVLSDTTKPDFLSEAIYYKVDHYFIPYRCLYSKNIRNLLMAGRCFSASHVGLGGPRVMNTTGQMGVATGYAASLCKKYSTNPRGVYKNHIKELRELIGII